MSKTARVGRRGRRWFIPAAIVGLALVLIALSFSSGNDTVPNAATSPAPSSTEASPPTTPPSPGTSSKGSNQPTATDLARRQANDPLAIGRPDASLAMVVYSDYQCGYCALWSEKTLPTLVSKYVDAGLLRIEWRDVNIFGPASERAARASYAAGLQGQFESYHHSLFPAGAKRSEAELSDEALFELAAGLGLDTERFRADMNTPETLAAIGANAQEGREIGVQSTPSFIVGADVIVGAQPTESFIASIDAQLASPTQ